jgi:tetratricopeptide (TPR) repeat protein
MRSALVTVGILLGTTLLAPAARAQTGGVRGKVMDEEGRPVVGSVVLVESESVRRRIELKTDKRGEYRTIGLPGGPYRVTATKDGYQARYVEVDVALGDTTEVPDIQIVSQEAISRVTGPSESDLRAKFSRGVELLRSSQFGEAEGIFRELVEAQPKVAEFHQNLAYAYARQKDWAHAEESYRQALSLKPGDSTLTVALAGVYEDAGETDKAGDLLNQAAAANPGDSKVQFERGVVFLKQQKAPEATEAFAAALAADPSLAEAHFHLGTLLLNQGKKAEAIEHLEAYLASNPDNAQYADTAKKLLEALKK